MDLRTGTPLWVTLIVALVTLFGNHLLTLRREAKKGRAERETAWRSSCLEMLEEIVDDVARHYFDPASIAVTQRSAALLNTKMKRLGIKARELSPTNSSDSAALSSLLRQMRDIVSLPEDFQDPNRSVRQADDPIMEKVESCEGSIKQNLSKARKLA